MKTAMQELIEYIESNEIVYNKDLILKLKELIEKEKKDLMKAFSDGQETPINHPTLPHYSRDEYYIDNYNQKELIIVDFDKVKE